MLNKRIHMLQEEKADASLLLVNIVTSNLCFIPTHYSLLDGENHNSSYMNNRSIVVVVVVVVVVLKA